MDQSDAKAAAMNARDVRLRWYQRMRDAYRALPVLVVAIWLGTAPLVNAATQPQIDLARDRAAAWLILNQKGDGFWANGATDISVSAQATSALIATGVKGFPVLKANTWLLNSKAESVDALSRVLMARALPNINQTPGFQTLISWRNSDITSVDVRMWGAYPQYTTSLPDTALAWRAILSIGYDLANLQSPFITTLCNTLTAQRPDGGWGLNRPPSYGGSTAAVPTVVAAGSVLATTQMALMLDLGRAKYPLGSFICGSNVGTQVTASINNSITWLTTTVRNPDGGVGENGVSTNIATALAYLALQTVAAGNAVTGALLDYMILGGRQSADGSWSGDPIVTAVMLEALSKVASAPVDSNGDGIPDSVATAMGAAAPPPGTGTGQPGVNVPILIANIPVNVFYSGNIGVTGGTGPYAWSISAGVLPPGLMLNPSTTASTTITGTPTSIGAYAFEYTVRDSTNAAAKGIVELVVVRSTTPGSGTGDVNGDGNVDLADVILAQRFALGLSIPSADQKARADVAPAGEPDGVIDASDVLRILRKALGLDNF